MQTLSRPRTKKLDTYSRPEIELLLCCARTHVDDENAERIKSLVQKDIDWQYLIQTASWHRTIPLLYTNLKTICREAVPEAAFNQIRNLFYANAQQTLLLTGELVKILRLLQEDGISAVAYKGPVLAASVYGNIALRPSGDLDIVVRQPDVLKFKKLLIEQGYKPKVELTEAEEIAYLQAKSEHTYNFIHDGKGIMVEIHWRITPEYTSPIETKHFWKKLEPFAFAGTTISTLPLEDWLPILCVHASRHRWERLNWLCDIAEIIRVQPGLNWERVIQQTREVHCMRMLFLGLFLAHRLLGVILPSQVLEKIKADSEVTALASQICNQLFDHEAYASPKFMERTIYHIRVRERLQDKFLYIQSFLHWLLTRSNSDHF